MHKCVAMWRFALILAGVASVPAAANPFTNFIDGFQTAGAQGKTTHHFAIDNDTLLLNRNDGFYSSGARYAHARSMRSLQSVAVYGWRIGQELYTASDINLPPASISRQDRPYAGWLYGGVFTESAKVDGSSSRFGIDIGCLGPCAGGEWTQTNFHRLIDQPLPQGWSTQVKNEFGVVAYGAISPARWQPGAAVDVTPTLHARIGNIFTDGGATLTVRAGRLNLLPKEPAFYGFVQGDVRAVAYNATLQGGYFSNHNPRTVDPKRLTGEVEAGVAWLDGPFGVRGSIVRRSNEIRGLPNSDASQNFLRLLFSYTP